MIDFRYHLVSVTAVFLALTVGLVLGSTLLQDPLLGSLESETADLRGQSEELRVERDVLERVGSGADEVVEAAADDVLRDRLLDTGVVLVAAPGADGGTVASLERRIEQAGGQAVGRVEMTEDFLAEDNATFLDELAVQVSPAPGDLFGGPHAKAGTELGRALSPGDGQEAEGTAGEGTAAASAASASGDGDGPGYDAEAVLSAYTEADLVTVTGSPAGSADALAVIAPAEGEGSGQDGGAAGTALEALTEALHASVGPTVLAAGPSSTDRGHVLARVRESRPPYSTVDVAGRPTGDVVTALALSAEVQGEGGSFGIGEGTRGFLPDPLPGPLEDEQGQERPEG